MPYTADRSHFHDLIERALDVEEIKSLLNRTHLDRETLRKSIMENANQIWEAAAKEIIEHDLLETRIEKREKEAAATPAILKLLASIYRFLRFVFLFRRDINSKKMPEELKVAKSNADDAVIRFGILPQLRRILDDAFWKSEGKRSDK